MRRLLASFVLMISPVSAGEIIDVPLDDTRCETFVVGQIGHSELCAGPFGWGLVLHHHGARIDLEITRPGKKRGTPVHRLANYLGDGQRSLAKKSVRWLTDAGQPKAFALSFDVEPQPYEKTIPFTLIFRVSDLFGDCPIAALGESSKLNAESVMRDHAVRACRVPFSRH